ncbi:MAG: hypothetical protein C0625_07820 [Arcobacter sp.]|mgnify:CR=1 FL=1|nr:MAG: hypothetical protein C0625_07820 [Arcobacter sp.]
MNNEIKIHDIKGLVDIPDISLYIYMTLWILGIAFIFVIIFLIYKFFYNKHRNERKKYYKILKELDLNDSKQSAYAISKYIRLLAHNEREKRLAQELIEELDSYKYKKDVEKLSDDVKIIFARFMDSIDV